MLIGVPKELYPDERRVALVPRGAEALRKLGFEVIVQSSAGDDADYSDAKYEEVGVTIAKDSQEVWNT